MPSFSAINVEPEDNIDDEVDNTRQLQVDDALKAYQVALRLHARGPNYYDEAASAYAALFDSAIFKLPEAATEYNRAHLPQTPLLTQDVGLPPSLDLSNPDADTSVNTLPQAYYLAYKNHGHFRLDRIKHQARLAARESAPSTFDKQETHTEALGVLNDFDAALDRDPSDAELWRRAARVAAFLKSSRISRYCLEAAIELDDDPTVVEVEPPSLAEGYAGEQLKKQLEVLGDAMALCHPAMGPYMRSQVADVLKRYLDPLPYLPDPTKKLAVPTKPVAQDLSCRLLLEVEHPSWTAVGDAITHAFLEHGSSGRPVTIAIPELPEEDVDVQMEMDDQLRAQIEAQVLVESTKAVTISPDVDTSASDPAPAASNDQGSSSTLKQSEEAGSPAPQNDSHDSASVRKRSQSDAGLPDAADEENPDSKRPKRARRRDTAVEDVVDTTILIANQLEPYQFVDENLFTLIRNILESLGVANKAGLDKMSEILDSYSSEDRMSKINSQVAQDLWTTINFFNLEHSKILTGKTDTPALGLSAFLEHTKSSVNAASEKPPADETMGLAAFVARVNESWFTVSECALELVSTIHGSYKTSKWSAERKRAVNQLICRLDDAIYQQATHWTQSLFRPDSSDSSQQATAESLVQMLFELHLDIYENVTNPNSGVALKIKQEAKARLQRWFSLRSQIFELTKATASDELSLRFLWAQVFTTTLVDSVSPDHVLDLLKALRGIVEDAGAPEIHLPNSFIVGEVSVKAADREISKLTTMDFFLGLFEEELGDPISVISSLEPVLDPDSVAVFQGAEENANGEVDEQIASTGTGVPVKQCAAQTLEDLWKFLQGSSTDLRLFLWKRLGDAYRSIKYTTKQFSCMLRSIELIVNDFERASYLESSKEARANILLQMMKNLDDLLVQALTLALNHASSFDILDEEHLKASSVALAKLSCILHICSIYDDEVAIGVRQNNVGSSIRKIILEKLRDFQSRTWCLQYCVLKAAMQQSETTYPEPSAQMAQLLGAIHDVLGARKICKASNRIFPKMMLVELLKMTEPEHWEPHLGQVLYDLHGLKLSADFEDHGCPAEKLEKRNAMALVEKITILANRMPMKDLLKSELKTTIEHMQQTIGQTKSTAQMIHNLRNFTEYIRKPIHPLRLYQAWKGTISIGAVTVSTAEAVLAKHGWFFMLGMIAFSKFKQVDLNRRQTPGATDDLRIGQTFLRSQIQFTPDRWDAWLRLAECYDYELDEAVLWTADKINKDRAELLKFQRNSIHCYSLALSHSYSMSRELSENDSEALFDLYYKFGMRMYASSREPFAMDPFKHEDHKRYCINWNSGEGTYTKILHSEMREYDVWKYAARLFRKAMACRPNDWKSAYMYSKCIWKMYQTPDDSLPEKIRLWKPTKEALVASLERAVEVVSRLPKPRHGQDPVLEPHYKIVVILHKMVEREDMAAQEAADILQKQPYAIQRGEQISIGDSDDCEDWESYVIRCIRQLRDKDKSNWQHRMIIRHAKILFNSAEEPVDGEQVATSGGNLMEAKTAFSVLRESMFTKTMVMNVWKCDAERAGRHHVYTEQYVRFMTRLLVVMDDRANMEALLRRIRKKGADFYHFTELWQSCVLSYVRLIRQSFQIPTTEDEIFKSTSSEEFDIITERITEWAGKLNAEEHHLFDAMKEAIELKKLNANLTKAGPIDDLISDCYGLIYNEVGTSLPGVPAAQILEERQKEKEAAAEKHAEAEQAAKPTGLNGFLIALDTKNSSRAGSEAPDKPANELVVRPRRIAGVRRLDVLRKAEQAVLRAMEPPAKSTAGTRGASAGEGRKSRLGSARSSNSPKAEVVGEAEQAEDSDDEMKDADTDAGADGDNEGSSSPRGSIHDSADDESDLSDVPPDYEENMPEGLMFPNLRRSMESGRVGMSESGTDVPSSPVSERDEEMGEDGDGDGEGSLRGGLGDESDVDEEMGEEEEGTADETAAGGRGV